MTFPPVGGWSTPLMRCMSTVFPAPLRPMIPMVSPSAISKLTLARAFFPSKCMESRSTVIREVMRVLSSHPYSVRLMNIIFYIGPWAGRASFPTCEIPHDRDHVPDPGHHVIRGLGEGRGLVTGLLE